MMESEYRHGIKKTRQGERVCAVLSHLTCSPALLTVTEGGRAHRSQAEALGSLLSSSITGLVGMPQLLTVVTELSTTALPATCDLWTAGTPKGYHCISAGGQTKCS